MNALKIVIGIATITTVLSQYIKNYVNDIKEDERFTELAAEHKKEVAKTIFKSNVKFAKKFVVEFLPECLEIAAVTAIGYYGYHTMYKLAMPYLFALGNDVPVMLTPDGKGRVRALTASTNGDRESLQALRTAAHFVYTGAYKIIGMTQDGFTGVYFGSVPAETV